VLYVLTDTPEKQKIEEEAQQKNKKIKTVLFPLQKKPEKNTKKHQSLFEIAPAELLNISDTNMSDGNLTDPESFTIDELTGFEELDRDPVEGDYVLVEFKIQKPRSNLLVFYVGKIIKNIDDDEI